MTPSRLGPTGPQSDASVGVRWTCREAIRDQRDRPDIASVCPGTAIVEDMHAQAGELLRRGPDGYRA